MADENDTSTFRLDLDTEKFVQGAQNALNAINEIGDSESIGKLVSGLTEAGIVLGTFGLALYGLKETFELVFDAEKIKQTKTQFDSLAASAGVYSDTLLKGLREASAGWVDDTTLMQHASKALAELQVGADKLPELMEAARKMSMVMGGDVTENFDKITRAVASGNAGMLKRAGIFIDGQKALRDYAASLGVTVDVLSEAGKQQAALNAVLDYSHKKLGDQVEDVRKATDMWLQVKTTITEIKDVLILAFEKIAGPTVQKFFGGLKIYADQAMNYFQDKFGTGAEQANAHAERMHAQMLQAAGSLYDAEKKLQAIKAQGAMADQVSIAIGEEVVAKKRKAYEDLKNQVSAANVVVNKLAQDEIKNEQAVIAAKKQATGGIDPVLQRKKEAEAAKELANINRQVTSEELKQTTDVAQAEALYTRQRLDADRQIEAQIQEIRAKQQAGLIQKRAADQQVEALHRLQTLRMRKDNDELWKAEEQALNRYVRDSKSAFDGVGRAFSATAQKSKDDLQDWGLFGTNTVSAFSKNATSSISAWGAGTKSATDAIEGMFAGMAGQMASQYGEMMMLASIWPPNPPAFAAGVALVALGGALGAIGSGSSSSGGSPASAGAPSTSSTASAGSSTAADTSSPATPAASATNATPGKSVTLVVQGNMLMQDQTQRWLVDQLRAASDSTDFRPQVTTGAGL